jgi:iron(II)-dependent oxidoreductase
MGWFAKKSKTDRPLGGPIPETAIAPAAGFRPAAKPSLSSDAVEAALQSRRYGALLHAPEEWQRLSSFRKASETAAQKVDDAFALSPDGATTLTMRINDEPGAPEREVVTPAFLLARRCVSNEDYQFFVDSGAYEDSALWPEAVWPHLIRFCDQTGNPGPKYWREGRHDQRQAHHPVVGICWFEAAVYAAWAGYRLASEAEWQVTAAWQVGTEATTARRYPWGDSLDLECCNIWASGHSKPLPVDACPGGATPNGVLQMIGNVSEWVDGDFDCQDDQGRDVVGETPLRCIRGGAYDTYFPWQATSQFRTGLPPLSRCHNVGFRCALSLPAEPAGS